MQGHPLGLYFYTSFHRKLISCYAKPVLVFITHGHAILPYLIVFVQNNCSEGIFKDYQKSAVCTVRSLIGLW